MEQREVGKCDGMEGGKKSALWKLLQPKYYSGEAPRAG